VDHFNRANYEILYVESEELIDPEEAALWKNVDYLTKKIVSTKK